MTLCDEETDTLFCDGGSESANLVKVAFCEPQTEWDEECGLAGLLDWIPRDRLANCDKTIHSGIDNFIGAKVAHFTRQNLQHSLQVTKGKGTEAGPIDDALEEDKRGGGVFDFQSGEERVNDLSGM